MNIFKSMVAILIATLCFSSVIVKAQNVSWDFENGNDDGFTLWSVIPATPAPEDTTTAGDESITGVGGDLGLPFAGTAWSIGPPNQFDGQKPAVMDPNNGSLCHLNADSQLEYGSCNDPFGVFAGGSPTYTNSRGQTSYLNTYNLNQWGDHLHAAGNDQIATSPPVELSSGAELTVWSLGGGGTLTFAPVAESDRKDGYTDGSCGIAVLSAADSSFLTSIHTSNLGVYGENKLDLSAYAGQTVIIEVVDAFEGSWGWLAVDEIQITNATVTGVKENQSTVPAQFELSQNYPNPFNPTTTIHFDIQNSGYYSLKVYNLLGEEVSTLLNGIKSTGRYSVKFDASNLTSGIYIYRLSGSNVNLTRKMLLIK